MPHPMTYQLSIGIFGSGTLEQAHWAFVIHQPGETYGDLLHVEVIDIPSNRFMFECRSGHMLYSQNATSLCKITMLSGHQRLKVVETTSKENPPQGGTRDCQDWILDALISLEAEELIPAGTAGAWQPRLGMETEELRERLGADYIPLKKKT